MEVCMKDKLLDEINSFVKVHTEMEKASYTEEYKNSQWYSEPSLSEVFGYDISVDIKKLINGIKRNEELTYFIELFKERAKEYGKSWYDEDLCCIRTGYKWETGIYVTLHNILAKSIGEKMIDMNLYYEGKGIE